MIGGRIVVIDELLRTLEEAIATRFKVLFLNLLVDAGKTSLYNHRRLHLIYIVYKTEVPTAERKKCVSIKNNHQFIIISIRWGVV